MLFCGKIKNMRTFILLFAVSALLCGKSVSVARDITNQVTEGKIPLKKKQGTSDKDVSRSATYFFAQAFFEGQTLQIDFLVSVEQATVTLIHSETGTIVYSELHASPDTIQIDLSGKESGIYQIEICTSESNCLNGEFTLL